jgi:hypothetical protein
MTLQSGGDIFAWISAEGVMRGDGSVIIGYLKSVFPGTTVTYGEGTDEDEVLYLVQAQDGQSRHLIRFSSEFINKSTPFEIIRRLAEWNLKARLDKAGKKELHVTSSGIKVAEAQDIRLDEPVMDKDIFPA